MGGSIVPNEEDGKRLCRKKPACQLTWVSGYYAPEGATTPSEA